MNDATTTVAELKQLMARFVEQRDWGRYHKPKNLAMSIAIESGELLELFQWLDHDECADFLRRRDRRTMLADELSDLLAYAFSLANVTGIDLAAAFKAKMARNRRKYPVRKVKGRYERPARRERT